MRPRAVSTYGLMHSLGSFAVRCPASVLRESVRGALPAKQPDTRRDASCHRRPHARGSDARYPGDFDIGQCPSTQYDGAYVKISYFSPETHYLHDASGASNAGLIVLIFFQIGDGSLARAYCGEVRSARRRNDSTDKFAIGGEAPDR
jgi:hypothetical protein